MDIWVWGYMDIWIFSGSFKFRRNFVNISEISSKFCQHFVNLGPWAKNWKANEYYTHKYTYTYTYTYVYVYLYTYTLYLTCMGPGPAPGPGRARPGAAPSSFWRNMDGLCTKFDELMTVEVPMKVHINVGLCLTCLYGNSWKHKLLNHCNFPGTFRWF